MIYYRYPAPLAVGEDVAGHWERALMASGEGIAGQWKRALGLCEVGVISGSPAQPSAPLPPTPPCAPAGLSDDCKRSGGFARASY